MAGMYGCFKRNSESSAMASGPPDVMANQEAAEATEECSGKKKSKFQTFKKFFARKKRKEPSASGADAALKGSQSTDNISKTSENNTLTQSEKEKGSGSKISLGSKALSHDSVFVSDSSEANEALGASQDSIHGKVKSLQLQLKQAIRLGSPPSLMCVKGTEDMGTMSEDDGLPCSPPEYTAHTALAQVQGNSSISLEGTDSDEDQLSCAASSRAVSPLVVVPGDFSQPASPFACLDNSAAKHKMGLRHKACNKRKPASRLELKAEEDSVVEDILNSSISEAVEENNEQKIRDASADEYKPEEKEEEEEEEQDQAEHSRQSLLSDKTEKEESSSEPEAEQDVSDGPDTSCPPEMGLSEEEATDAWPLASSETGSRASSVDSPRGTPEPPAGQIEYLMDPPGTTYGTEEKRDQSDSVLGLTGGEDGEQETEEEESSLLQEVLSSLKTPLNSPLVETESIVLEMEQEEAKNGEEEKEDEEEEEKKAETEEGEEVKEEDGEEPVLYQAVVSGSSISDQNTKEEEEEVTTTTASYNDAQEEMKHVKEEEEDDSTEEEEEDEEEELVVEHFSQNDVEEVEKEDVVKTEAEEENSLPATQTDNQVEEEGEEKKTEEEKEEEEEAKELEQEPETKAEKLEKTVEDNKEDGLEVEEKNEEVEESEEANEDEKDVQEKMFSEADGGEMVVDPEETVDDFNAINKDETEYEKDGDTILPGQEEEVFDMVHESQKAFDQMELKEQNLDQEKDTGATEPNMEEDGSEQDEEQESIEVLPQETKQEEVQSDVDTTVSSRPSSLTLPETPTTPSKTSTIHINLVSPSAENFASCFQLPPSTVEAKESLSTAEEPGDKVEKAAAEEEAKQPCDAATATDKEAKLSSPIDETSKVRFTIIPAWQRSLSIGEKDSSALPSSPPASVSSSPATGGMEVATMEERLEKAELASSAKAEVVLSPSRAKNAEMTTTKPQWNTSPPPESSAVVEGNPNNPFGVRLRKTSALHRFSSEEENAEPVHESAPQPSSCTADAPQPLSVKPSVSQPISNKPALPKKPEVMGDGGGKTKWILDPTAARGGSDPPSWISVAKQKQKVYKENSADNTAVQKEEQERRSSLPTNSSSNKTPESSSKVSPLELNKSSASAEKESRRSLSPPTPVPPQPTKSLSPPFPVPPKPHVTTSITPKPSPQRSLSPPTPVPVAHRPPSCTSPPSTSKPPPSLPTGNMTLTSPPFSSPRTTPAQSAGSSPTPAAQRGVPSPALTQDEPPWMALAKKKAKAWSEMPQIVQ